ncbi:MAG TPA: hypothetical protein VGT03_11775 [Candidatus Acidoferrales bacterium]|nr:hypothetical protein [Candidatus Acidoferrales bacterium]
MSDFWGFPFPKSGESGPDGVNRQQRIAAYVFGFWLLFASWVALDAVVELHQNGLPVLRIVFMATFFATFFPLVMRLLTHFRKS